MGITPLIEIVIVDIHSASIGNLTVYNNYLSMVAVIQFSDKIDNPFIRICEPHDINPRALHLVIISGWYREIGDILIDKADFNALGGFFRKEPKRVFTLLMTPNGQALFFVEGIRSGR